ncbi:MAG TPA: hypothetical protein VIV06_03520, partial [Candidatus Limnocylindrales bacterium]
YVGDRLFNALHGAQRMVFGEPAGRWSVDLVFDALAMSHRIDLRSRLSMSGPTLDLADLVLTKLQVWEINEKDLGDVACLLADHPLGGAATASADHTAIDLDRLTSLLGSDWGLCHTVERNLARVAELWASTPAPGSPHDVGVQVATLVTAIEGAPKSIGWRARARVGERVRWYETPEEVRR